MARPECVCENSPYREGPLKWIIKLPVVVVVVFVRFKGCPISSGLCRPVQRGRCTGDKCRNSTLTYKGGYAHIR